MNKRSSDRFESDLLLIICKNNVLMGTGTIRNMGSDGIFIESDFSDIRIDQPIKIEFCMNDVDALQNCIFKAKIVHKKARGFGARAETAYRRVPIALRKPRYRINMASNRHKFLDNKLFLHID